MDDAEKEALRAKYERPALRLPQSAWRRDPRMGLLGVVLVVFLGLFVSLRIPLQRSDDFYRVIGGWSLAAGQGYADISRPDAPFLTKYPPLPSLLMVPFLSVFGDFLRPLRLFSQVLYLVSLPLVYRLLVPRVGHRSTLLILLLAGLSPLTLRGMNFEGNSGLISLLIVSSLLFLERLLRPKRNGQTAVLLGSLLAAFFYCHRIGIVFGLGSILYLFFVARERRLALLVALVFGGLSFPWLWRSYQLSGHWISPEYEREIVGRSVEGASERTPSPLALVQHMLQELRQFPSEVGYQLFPWSRASGGQPWPFLKSLGLVWVSTLSEWVVATLVVIGWARSLRARRFTDLYLILHSLMLLVFFFGFQYFAAFLPWFYLYLKEGAQWVLRAHWSRTARLGFVALLLVVLAKDTKAFWMLPMTSLQDRDLRWSWISKAVPERETVYYLGLENYAFSQLRYFDSGRRMAVGIEAAELETKLSDPLCPWRWVCLPKSASQNALLEQQGWQRIAAEPEGYFQPKLPPGVELSEAHKKFLSMVAPPQALWHRP